MSKQDNGGPALPVTSHWDAPHGNRNGMTLRDYFAAKAMVALLQTAKSDKDVVITHKAAYAMADLMLEARKL